MTLFWACLVAARGKETQAHTRRPAARALTKREGNGLEAYERPTYVFRWVMGLEICLKNGGTACTIVYTHKPQAEGLTGFKRGEGRERKRPGQERLTV